MDTDANSTGFDTGAPRVEPTRPLAWLRRAILALVALVVLSGLGSGYRAIAPPKVELSLGSPDENVVAIRVRSTGRGVVNLTVEWIEAERSLTLAKLFVPGRDFPVFDFRSVTREFHVPLPGNQSPGATVRVTALPSRQWTWQPPAVIRELAVTAAASAPTSGRNRR